MSPSAATIKRHICLYIHKFLRRETVIELLNKIEKAMYKIMCDFYMISLELIRIFNLGENFIFSIRQSTLIVIVSLCEHHMCESLCVCGRTKRIPGGAWVRSTSALYSKCHQSPPLSVTSRPNSNLGAACHWVSPSHCVTNLWHSELPVAFQFKPRNTFTVCHLVSSGVKLWKK